ncbi:hypothetical protein HDU86_007276 [Geranomyces michiganensis]|nr:hypothetical protein HDU86_007276 [Geranomyces michiganensis]
MAIYIREVVIPDAKRLQGMLLPDAVNETGLLLPTLPTLLPPKRNPGPLTPFAKRRMSCER